MTQCPSGDLARLSDSQQWQLMIPRMGIFALLRNLRNFDQAEVPDDACDVVRSKLGNPEVIRKSGILPFQILSAYLNTSSMRWGPSLEAAIGASAANIPELPGRTAVLIDTSRSMTGRLSGQDRQKYARPGARESVRPTRMHAAALFGIATALRNAGRADVWGFADGQFRVTGIEPGDSILRTADVFCAAMGKVGHGTRIADAMRAAYDGHDRMFIFTDEQTFPGGTEPSYPWGGTRHGDVTTAVPPETAVYAFNLAGYENSSVSSDGTSRRYMLGGLTDDTFKMIPRLEAGIKATWPWE